MCVRFWPLALAGTTAIEHRGNFAVRPKLNLLGRRSTDVRSGNLSPVLLLDHGTTMRNFSRANANVTGVLVSLSPSAYTSIGRSPSNVNWVPRAVSTKGLFTCDPVY